MTTEEDVGGATGGPTAEDNMSAVAAVGAAVAGPGVVGAIGGEVVAEAVAEAAAAVGLDDDDQAPEPAPDTTAPVVTLIGDASVTIEKGTTYIEQGATASDFNDDDVPVTITGYVDADTVGTYTITYSATDASGNTGLATRTVNVVEAVGDAAEEVLTTAPTSAQEEVLLTIHFIKRAS